MDAAPRGLAPGGPGATGSPLVDWILPDAGLAAAVFAYLAPRDVLGLRVACAGASAAVAAHPWYMELPFFAPSAKFFAGSGVLLTSIQPAPGLPCTTHPRCAAGAPGSPPPARPS
jgi:hypothetical protein